ncbi:MAG: Hemolysin, chromosomal, partial [Verrucomicrobiota bacterium]
MRRVFSALLLTLLLGHAAALADVDASLAHTNRVYDAATDRVFCLTGGSITPVNPATGALEAPIVVTTTSNLIEMQLSLMGSQLFVSHDNNKRLAQVDLVSRTVVADWSAGTDANGAKTFFSFAALPGMPQRVVTSTVQFGSDAFEVYDNGSLVSSTAQFASACLLAPGNVDGEWFAIESKLSSPCQMQRLQITGSTLSPAVLMGDFPTPNGSAVFERKGRLILIGNSWFDAFTLLPNGTRYNYAAGWDYHEASQRLVLTVGDSSSGERVVAMDARTMAAVEERDPPEVGNSAVVLCGDRLALCKPDGIRFRDWRMTPKPDEADLMVRQIPGPSSLTPGQPVSFSVLVRNAGRAMATGTQLTWSGIAVASADQVTTPLGSVQISGGNVSVSLGDLPPDRQATVTIQIPSQPSGSPSVTAAASCSKTESSTVNNTHALSLGSLGHGFNPWIAQQFSRNMATLYDKAGRRFFALMGDTSHPGNGWDGRVSFWAGQVMEMLPEQKHIVAFHVLPGMGGCIATQDGRLHAGLINRGTIVSKALTEQAWEAPIAVGTNANGVPWQPVSLAVAEGTAVETLLVARRDSYSGVPTTLAAYQAGSLLPNVAAACDQVISAGPGRVAATRFIDYQTMKFMRYSLGASGLSQLGEQTLLGSFSGVMHYARDTCFYNQYRISMFTDSAGLLYGTPPPLFGAAQPEGAVPDPSLNRFYWLDAYPGKLTTDAISPSSGIVQKSWPSGSQRGNAAYGTFRWGDYGLATASLTDLVLSEHAGFIPPPPVQVTLPDVLAENAGIQTGAGTVSISRPEATALTVNLVSSTPSTLAVPASVTIPAGALTATFDVTPVPDAALTGPKKVTVTASATNFTSTPAIIWVGDAQSTPITLTVPATLAENAGVSFNAGSVSIGQALPMALDVLVSSNHASALGIKFSNTPSSVITIPAGQTSVSFDLTINDNSLLDGDKALTLTASVPGWPVASAPLTLVDDESPVLSFDSDPIDRREQAGAGFGVRIYFGGQLMTPLTLTLQSSDETEVIVTPSQVTVPVGSSSMDMICWLVDDDLVDGAQNVTLTASAPGFATVTKTAIVRDNELGQLVWDPVPASMIAGSVINTQIRAQTIDGDPLTFTGQISFSAGGRHLSPLTKTGDGAIALRLFQAGNTIVTASSGSISGDSGSIEVQAGPAASFQWSSLPPTILQNSPVPVQLNALDLFGNAATTYNGTANLSAVAPSSSAQVGSDTYVNNAALNTAHRQVRTQFLLRQNEIGGTSGGPITAISLHLPSLPPRAFDDLTIRVKYFNLYYPPSSWESTGWTVLRSGPWMPQAAGWVAIPAQNSFAYDGVSGLLVDISFMNDSVSETFLCYETDASGWSAWQSGAGTEAFGPPTTWSGSSPGLVNTLRPNIRLEFGNPVSVTPSVTGAFVNGGWTGDVSLAGTSAASALLQASNGAITSRSASFELGRLPLQPPNMLTEPGFTPGLSNTVSWGSVAGAGEYLVQRAANPSFTVALADSGWITGTSHFFDSLSDDTTYHYRVKNRRADDATVESGWSAIASSAQDDNTPSLTVSHLNAQNEIQSMRPIMVLRGSYLDATSGGSVTCSATVSGGLSTMQSPLSLDGTVRGTWSTTIEMPASGSTTATLTATDAAGHSAQQVITLVRLTDAGGDGLADEWQQSAGLFSAGLSAADTGPLGDPDSDGMSNLMELACGTPPLVSGGSSQTFSRQVIAPTLPGLIGMSSMHHVISFDRRRGAAIDFSFVPQSSTSLTSWSDVSSFTETVVPNPDGLTERVTWAMPENPGGISIIFIGIGGGLGGSGGSTTPTAKFFRTKVSVLA